MKIVLKRKFKGESYTIGDLYIDDVFFCNTLEDKGRNLPVVCPNTSKWQTCKCKEKVYAETAIPCGIYKITLEKSSKFKKILPLLHNVPHFLGILMHAGKTEHDSAGCIIVGKNTEKGKVLHSKNTLEALIEKLKNQSEISIEII